MGWPIRSIVMVSPPIRGPYLPLLTNQSALFQVKAKSQFKRRSTANNVEIMIPVPNDADSPKFKTTIGK